MANNNESLSFRLAAQQVDLYDFGISLGPVTMTGPDTWTKTVSGLALTSHQFTAKGANGTPVSNPWELTVAQAAAPTISSVRDSTGEVPPDGITVDTRVTLSGTAAKSQTVRLYQDGKSLGDKQTDADGRWTWDVAELVLGKHSFQAEGRYGGNPSSGIRSFIVYRTVDGYEGFVGLNPWEYILEIDVPKHFLSGLIAVLKFGMANVPNYLGYMTMYPDTHVNFALNGYSSRVDFDVSSAPTGGTVTYRGANDEIIHTQEIRQAIMSYTAPHGKAITAFEVRLMYGNRARLDYIRWFS